MPFDAFISYSHQDKPTADAACAALEAAGIRCWIAPRDIVPGKDWGESIIDAIADVRVMVLIFSGHANASPQIKREVERAVNRGTAIIPVRIEDVAPSKSLEYFISTPHWLDAFPPPPQNHFKRLVASVRALLEVKPDGPGDSAVTLEEPVKRPDGRPAPTWRRSFPRLRLFAAAAGMLLLIGLGIIGYRTYQGYHERGRTLANHMAEIDSSSFSPDGQWVATGGYDGAIKIWDFKTGRRLQTVLGHTGKSVPFSPDGAWIASASDIKNVRIWDAVSGQPFRTFVGHTDKVMEVAFMPDGKQIVSAGLDNTIKVWDTASGQLVRTLEGHANAVTSLAISRDGKRIASASRDKTVIIWNAATGEIMFRLEGHSAAVETVAMSPDGKWLASAGDDSTVRGWDAESGQPLQRLIQHQATVLSIAFSPTGKWIASADYTGLVKISDSRSGATVATLAGHSGWVSTVRFSPPDGAWIESGGKDMLLKVWQSP